MVDLSSPIHTGGKAASLVCLARAGFRVPAPDHFVVDKLFTPRVPYTRPGGRSSSNGGEG